MLRTLLFLLMGAGVIAFSFVAWVSLHPPAPAQAQSAKITVLAAANTLRAGTLLKPDDIEAREMMESEVPKGARRDGPQARAELFGAMVRQTLLQHQIVLPSAVMRPGDHGFLAAVLTPGRRATSVGVDAISGTAGLIWPGDHVDLILTQDIADNGANTGAGGHVAAETVLRDVRVIAIDQQLVQGGGPATTEATSRTVTLEVTPEDVERVAVSAHLGRLSLAVRPVDAAPGGELALRPVTWARDVSNALKPPTRAAAAKSNTLHVYSGTTDKEYHY